MVGLMNRCSGGRLLHKNIENMWGIVGIIQKSRNPGPGWSQLRLDLDHMLQMIFKRTPFINWQPRRSTLFCSCNPCRVWTCLDGWRLLVSSACGQALAAGWDCVARSKLKSYFAWRETWQRTRILRPRDGAGAERAGLFQLTCPSKEAMLCSIDLAADRLPQFDSQFLPNVILVRRALCKWQPRAGDLHSLLQKGHTLDRAAEGCPIYIYIYIHIYIWIYIYIYIYVSTMPSSSRIPFTTAHTLLKSWLCPLLRS